MAKKEKTYSAADARRRIKTRLPKWKLVAGWLTRQYKTNDWAQTMLVVNAVGYVAEQACHHPDLAVSYASVTVRLRTHSARGITDKDFALAARIEDHVMWRPKKTDALPGYEVGYDKDWVH